MPNKGRKGKGPGKAGVVARVREAVESTRPRAWISSFLGADPFPARVTRRMNWAQESTLTSATTAYQAGTENLYRLNSLFDPDQSGGTHQPYGFDTMAALYGRYVVHACTIDVTVSQLVGQVSAYVMNIQPSNAVYVTTGNSIGNISEQPNTKLLVLDPQGRVFHARQRITMAELEGVSEAQLRANLEEYAALVTASPTRVPLMRVAFANMAGAAAIDCRTVVRLEYEVEFYDRIQLGPSS